MKLWPPVMVEWIDAHGGDEGWQELSAKHQRPEVCVTVGMLAAENDLGVTLVLSSTPPHHRDKQYFGGYTFIPKVNIVRTVKLVPDAS